MKLTIDGDRELKAQLKKIARRYPDAMAVSLWEEGYDLQRRAVKRAPVDVGILRSSAYTSPPKRIGANTVVETGFGTTYARAQHENATYRHPKGGEAKYLENALRELINGYVGRLISRTNKNAAAGRTPGSATQQGRTTPGSNASAAKRTRLRRRQRKGK